MPQGANQNDDSAQVDLATEEAHRRRCRSLPAPLAIAAEAQSDAQQLGKPGGATAGFPQIIGGVKASATRTSDLANCVRKILVNCEKEPPKPGGTWQIVIHG